MKALRTLPALAACLLGLTACSGSDGGGDSNTGQIDTGPTSGPVSKEALGKAVVGAVPGYKVAAASGVGGKDVRVAEDDEGCLPVAHALAGVALGKPESVSGRRLSGDGVETAVTLGLYDRDGGPAVMDGLAEALKKCAGGFDVTVAGAGQRVAKVVAEVAPQGAEQAMAFGAEVTREGKTVPVKVVVFRKGYTVGQLSATAAKTGTKDFVFPVKVFEAQIVRLA
ncbi:hypothetical protein ABZ714_33360 [Streptomyces sp. NPDC006798]|uniref:hypothetical protein n=1 Tax=Streptomyces sp. NPDC006798 TaxID=3155462 RepID=UPI0033F2C2CD